MDMIRNQPSYDSKTLLSYYSSMSSSMNGTIGGDSNRSTLAEMLRQEKSDDEFDCRKDESSSSRTVTTHAMMDNSESNKSLFESYHDELNESQNSLNHTTSNSRDSEDQKNHGASAASMRTGTDTGTGSGAVEKGDVIAQVESKEKPPKCLSSSMAAKRIDKFRDWCGLVVNNERFQLLIIFLIVVNALMMGIGTFDFVTENSGLDQAWERTDRAFLIIFTLELAMQFVYHGLHLFADSWLLFDFIIVVGSWSLQSLQVIRAFRVFRAFRLITRFSLLKNLVVALVAVAPSMGAILALLLLILYIYAVMCTVLFKDLYEQGVTDKDYFGRLDITLFTLFQMMTLEWAGIVRQVMVKYYWASFVFSTFLIMTSFILYSLIIAVVCDAVKITEHHGQITEAMEEKEESRFRIQSLSEQVDKMTIYQSTAMEAIQFALEELRAGGTEEMERDGHGGSSQQLHPRPTLLPHRSLHASARQRHVTYNLEPGYNAEPLRNPPGRATVNSTRGARTSIHVVSNPMQPIMSDDDDDDDSESELVFESDSDTEPDQESHDSRAAAAESVPQDERHYPTEDQRNS
jgi:hypothetical protein